MAGPPIKNHKVVSSRHEFVHTQDWMATKIAYVEPNILPEPIEFYTGMPVVPVTNSMSGY